MNTIALNAAQSMISTYYPVTGSVYPRPSVTPDFIRSRTLAADAPYSTEWVKAQKAEGSEVAPVAGVLAMLQVVTSADWQEVAKAIV